MKHEVEFESAGTTVRGDLYMPEGDGPFPAVVLGGGWLFVKELSLPFYAEACAARGIAALAIDYRHFGSSDGEPRQHVDSWAQIEDLRNGLSYLETRSEIDPQRLGAWGISFGGGLVLVLGALDDRVRCIVSNVPVVDGFENMRRIHGTESFRSFRAAIADDRRKRFATGEYGFNVQSGRPTDDVATCPVDDVAAAFDRLKREQAPRYEGRNTVASNESLLAFSVWPHVERLIETPVLMILAEGDDLNFADLATNAFNDIPTVEKKLVTLPDTEHMQLYADPVVSDLVAGLTAEWFSRHLSSRPTVESVCRLAP
jgi:pimeloyl-ACP methyl ester carboxylesterase